MTAPAAPRRDDTVWTVGKVLEWTQQHLKKSGSETPRLDAEVLLAHSLGCPRIQLYVKYHEVLSEDVRAVMRELVKRRSQAEPVAYLVGHREFFGLDLDVTRDVLIPRPETETLVLATLQLAQPPVEPPPMVIPEEPESTATPPTLSEDLAVSAAPPPAPQPSSKARVRPAAAAAAAVQCRILDVGTGSGCIAIALAKQLPAAQLTAIDISPAALAVARRNAEKHQLDDRICFLQGDLFAPLSGGKKSVDDHFDFIVSNPPYVAQGEMASLAPDIRLHEPPSALAAGPEGLDVLRRLVAEAPRFLQPRGWLLCEFAPEQVPQIRGLIEQTGAFDPPEFFKDPAGDLRFVKARLAAANGV